MNSFDIKDHVPKIVTSVDIAATWFALKELQPKLKQKEYAELVGISRATLSRYIKDYAKRKEIEHD